MKILFIIFALLVSSNEPPFSDEEIISANQAFIEENIACVSYYSFVEMNLSKIGKTELAKEYRNLKEELMIRIIVVSSAIKMSERELLKKLLDYQLKHMNNMVNNMGESFKDLSFLENEHSQKCKEIYEKTTVTFTSDSEEKTLDPDQKD